MWHSHLNDMEIPETKRFIPKGFELGTTLSSRLGLFGCTRINSDVFDSHRFRYCCRLIARYFPLCLSFARCIFETKLVLNIVGGHQNHWNRPVATPDEIVDLW